MSQDPTLFISGTVLFSGLVGLGGYLVASKARGREDERERKRIARQMKARVDEHYATYLDLEQRVKLVIAEFDRVDEHSEMQISARDKRIVALQEEIRMALSNTQVETEARFDEAVTPAAEMQPQNSETQAQLEKSQAQLEEKRAQLRENQTHLEDARVRIERAQSAIATLQSEKAAELEEHAARIGALQSEIDNLHEAHRVEIERVNARADEARLVDAVEPQGPQACPEDVALLQSHADEIECLSSRLADYEPLQAHLAASEARVQELSERCEVGEMQVAEERERHAQEIAQLEQRAAENAERAELLELQVAENDERAEALEREAQVARERVEGVEAEVLAARQRAAEAEEEARAAAQETLLAQQRSGAAQEEITALRATQAQEGDCSNSEHEGLQARVEELEPLTGEITELREQCVQLERNAESQGTRARNLEAELAAREEEIRELGADPQELAAERKARVASLRECVQELGKLSDENDRHDEQLGRLESFHDEREAELEAEVAASVSSVAAIESGLSPLFDSVDSLIDSLSEARGRVTALEVEATATQSAHAKEQAALIELLKVADENMPSPAELELHEQKMHVLEDRYEGLLAEKELELTRLVECVAELEPLKAAVEELSNTLEEKNSKTSKRTTRKKAAQPAARKKTTKKTTKKKTTRKKTAAPAGRRKRR